ncbi:MAG: septum formation protein Maf [Rhodospirillaceae bacterium]|nr:septum formation protein Maf [Rhodospirillaceae bacterium]MBT5944075.1 septum formation protein Maf [Rhodospirillaceae bacterium]MBT6402980.1 septum formation protein Maf [Rhodospirillaceae bacterium]MBT6537057.1 septum formation protein Maf [Rhodospirillaceae bacterium]MBT7361847.1 septum formation protein Maf [Rhodospirillaceae bacterium]
MPRVDEPGSVAISGGVSVVLASASAVRTRLLTAAGVPHDIIPADIDEGDVRDRLLAEGATHGSIAEVLAELKAQHVATDVAADMIVLGADQVLSCEGELFEKPDGLEGVRGHLNRLRGRAHTLHAAVCAVRGGEVIWHHNSSATLRMRTLTDAFIERYVEIVGEAACRSVGAYEMEGMGPHLFSEIDGDFFDILGLPLLPVLEFLRNEEVVMT